MELKNVKAAKKNLETANRELEEAMTERAEILWEEIRARVREWGRIAVPIIRDGFPDTDYSTEESNVQLLTGFINSWLVQLSPNVVKVILKQLIYILENEDEDEN